MLSGEKKKLEAFSWWCDGSHNHRRHYQPQWLQANLSEVEEKIKVMVSIIEEDGDSFAKRAEMYYKGRPQLLKILDDLHKSYHCLAEKYDQLIRSDFDNRLDHVPASLKSLRSLHLQNDAHTINPSRNSTNTGFELGTADKYDVKRLLSTKTNDQAVACKSTRHFCNSKEQSPQTVFERQIIEKSYSNNTSTDDGIIRDHLLRRDNIMWSEKEVSELIEDHLRQQAELVKRNEEKREKIRELRSVMKKLAAENQALKASTSTTCADVKASPIPIPKLVNNKDANRPKGTLFQLAKLTGCTR